MNPVPHRFGDAARARTALVKWTGYLQALDPEAFADETLRLLEPFEREKPLRRLLRNRFPHGEFGFVVEDLDLVLRPYGAPYSTDQRGLFRLVETKWNPKSYEAVLLDTAQQMTFRLMDEVLRKSPEADRYLGFFIVSHTHYELLDGRIWIAELGHRSSEVTTQEFLDWLGFEDRRVA